MLLSKKGQSTAEYAIIIALVIAVAAGVLQVALKGGIRKKNDQAMSYLLDAGNAGGLLPVTPSTAITFSQDYRKTTVLGGAANYADKSTLYQGGAKKDYQKQSTTSESVSVEMMDALR